MKTDFNTKLSGLLRLLLPLSTSERVMEMLYDDSVSAEKVKEYVMNSLHDLIAGRLSEDEGVLLSKRLLLLFLLSQMQEDVCADIERSLKGKSVYRFTIKHNHERIKNLIRSNYNDFYRNFSPQQTDMFCEDADGLTKIVNEYMGINDTIL